MGQTSLDHALKVLIAFRYEAFDSLPLFSPDPAKIFLGQRTERKDAAVSLHFLKVGIIRYGRVLGIIIGLNLRLLGDGLRLKLLGDGLRLRLFDDGLDLCFLTIGSTVGSSSRASRPSSNMIGLAMV